MSVDFSKTSHIVFFAAALPLVSFGIGYYASLVWSSAPFWVETLSPLAAYGLLYSFFNKIAWRWQIFRWLNVTEVHDMSGRWYGTQLSSFKKDGKPFKSRVVIEIEQQFSSIKARAYYKRWQTPRTTSTLLKVDGQSYLVMIFESEPTAHHDGDDAPHKGVLRLQYYSDDDTIRGAYFNTNGNTGEITLKRSPKPILHRFSAESVE